MARYTGNKYRAGVPAISGDGKGDVIAVTSYATILNAGTALTDGDMIDLVKIPAGHEIVGLSLFCGDLDANGSPSLTFSVGLYDAADTALDTVFVADSTLGQAGGTLGIPTATTMFTTAAATADKVLGIEVTATAGTKGAADRVIGVTVLYAPV